MTKHLHLKKVLATLLTIAALAAGQQAFATISQTVTFQGMTYTQNNNSYYSLQINGIPWGNLQLPNQQGTSCQFNNAHLSWGPVFVTLNGNLRFKESTTATDVVAGGTFTVTFESQSLWFYGASVKKLDGTNVTNSSVTVSSDKHTVTVAINNDGTEFGQIILDYVPNEPFNSTNTGISGIATEYIYTGSPIEPVPTVTYKGTVLTAGTDYTVSYANNNALGTATLTVTGTGQYAGTISHDYNIRAVALSDFNSLGNNTYEIASTTDLDLLAVYVNLGNNCQDLTFKQTADITFTHSDDWDNSSSTENNYTAIGTAGNPFQGTYDGQNHTISGIRIYKGGTSNSDKRQGIFGAVSTDGTVKRVNLADARITGCDEVGGIVGVTFKATIEDCTVGADVCIHAVKSSTYYHGGIVGLNQSAVRRCISRATLTVKNGLTDCNRYGGIVGYNSNSGTVTDCIAVGAVIPDVEGRGAIVGKNHSSSTLQRNYYRNCTVNGTANATNVGCDGTDIITNQGALALYSLTLPDNVTTDRTASAILPGTGNKTYTTGADINGTPYYCQGGTVTLVYNNLPEGYRANYTATGGTINGNILTMPAANVTVTVALVPDWSGSGTQTNPYVITTTAQLDALAAAVKSGTTYSGTYFVLGNDIAYSTIGLGDTDENFTTIGGYFNGGDKNFSGTFDGQGHTISGIRLYKTGNSNPSKNQGLFGRISGATIKNVILTDARITGYRYVGGIVGNKASGTVQNCLVLESTITCENTYVGALFGGNSGTITANHYHGCTVNGTANATNVGVGGNGGTSSSSDKNGARSAHTLTLGENVTATGESVTYQGTTYYASTTTVTLGYDNLPAGYTVTYTLNGTALSGNTFTMPANDAVVSAILAISRTIAGYGNPDNAGGYYLIASPVGTVDPQNVTYMLDNSYDLYYFDQAENQEWRNYEASAFDLEAGKGYLYANSEDVTLVFFGMPYSGNGEVTLSKTTGAESEGWNLVGNPFNETAYLADGRGFYTLNGDGSELMAVTSGSIEAMEGIFVVANEDGETLTFTTTEPGNNGKGIVLNISQSRGASTLRHFDELSAQGPAVIDRAIVRLGEGRQLPKFQMRDNSTKVYIPQGGEEYAVACVSAGRDGVHTVSTNEIPVNFKAAENGSYTITVNTEGVEMAYLHLIDNLTGADIDLLHPNAVIAGEGPVIAGEDPQSPTPMYTFYAKTTDYESRFKLVFAANGEDGPSTGSGTFAFISNGNIIVNGEGVLQIIDGTGRVIRNSDVARNVSTNGMTPGVYVLRLINGDDVRTQKIVID